MSRHDFRSNGEIEADELAEAERQRLADEIRAFAAQLRARRPARRSHDQVNDLVDGLTALVASMKQVSARRWEGGRRGPDIGNDPSKWPKRIDSTGLSAT